VGEIAFLRGWPATATVTARTEVRALVIDDPTLARLEREEPATAARLLRQLAETAEERTSANLAFESRPSSYANAAAVEIQLCRTPEMRERAQRLRYEVYCEELKRKSPHADHERRIISDDLDRTAHTFIAIEAGETIGTLRGNFTAEGSVGVLEELYGMKASPYYPTRIAVCTKLVIKKSKRGGPAAMKLIGAMVRFGTRYDTKDCYIDSVPALLPYYKAIGFSIVAEPFFHRENGPSYPMLIDVAKHGPRLSRDFTPLDYVKLYAKAKAIKWAGRLLGRGERHRHPTEAPA
jgi:CRP-like cAMP-binding protein